MRIELPTQSQIVEELADRVANQIDAGKPVAFDGALEELVGYHRFVLGLSASTTPDGDPFNYAELAGNAWRPPHLEWLRQYRRLFERAADKIPDDEHFIVSLAYTMGRLIRLPDDLVPSNGVTDAVLNLFPSLIGSVEAWVTKRAIAQENAEGAARQILAGSDARAYRPALLGIIGAWEALFQYSRAITDLSRRAGPDPAQTWALARRSWPFTYRHLVDTAYSVAIAVWNDDHAGAMTLREALVRWPDNIRHQLPHPLHVRHPELVMPDLLRQDWEAVRELTPRFAYQLNLVPDPGELFAAIVFHVHADVRLLLARVLIYWAVNGKRAGPAGAKIAIEILSGFGAEDDGQVGEPVSIGSLLFALIRQQIAGERYEDGSYGANLDDVIRHLDGMTEKDQVSGRVYRPTTANERDDLIWADVVLLANYSEDDDRDGLDRRIRRLLEAEDALPRRDRTLRNILHEIDRYLDAVDTKPTPILNALKMLGRGDAGAQIARLGDVIRRVRDLIVDYRLRRLSEREISKGKLEERRAAVEQALLDEGRLDFFTSATIVPIDDAESGEVHCFSASTSKARLLDPPMDQDISGEVEALATSIAHWANNRPSSALLHSDPTIVDGAASPLDPTFWAALRPLIAEVGLQPRLVLPYRFHGPLIDLIYPMTPDALPGFSVEERQNKPRQYVCTVEGVDIYVWGVEANSAWLFSSNKLRTIRYGLVDGQRVTVEFSPADGSAEHPEDRLLFRFRPSFEWNDGPVFRIMLPDGDGAEDRDNTSDSVVAP